MLFRFLAIFLLVTPTTTKAFRFQPGLPQSTTQISETQILDNLRSIRDQLGKLKLEIDQKAVNSGRPDRKSMDYGQYSSAFTGYQGKIEEFYRQLSACYEQIGRVYRTNPKSPVYKSLLATYLEAKLEYDTVSSLFGAISPPEKIRGVAVVSADKRLNKRISTTVNSNQPPANDDPREIFTADEVQFLGTFDAVEMFLLIKGDNACYVFYGWREEGDTEAGRKNQTYHLSVLRSEFFPKEKIKSVPGAEQHLELALKLNFFTLSTQGDAQNEINQFLNRVKSYSRGN